MTSPPDSLQIALVHPYPWAEVRRGGERYLQDLAWYLSRAGHRVDVLTSSARWRPTVNAEDGIEIRSYPRLTHPWLDRRRLSAMETHGAMAAFALCRRRYDLVHALTPTGALAGIMTRHRTVYTELGHPTRESLSKSPGGLQLHREAVNRSTAVTALSRSAASALAEVSGRIPDVLPPGTRLDRFTPNLAPRSGPPRLLFMADAGVVGKRVDLALEALDRLLVYWPEARLILGGPGSHQWALARLGRQALRVEHAVDVIGVGHTDDLADRYRGATVSLLPSTFEAFGLVLTESLACGTPVVCTHDSGMREIVDDPRIGRTFAPGDLDGLVDGIVAAVALARDPGTPARCARHARRWGWAEEVGPAHEALYHRVISGGRRPIR